MKCIQNETGDECAVKILRSNQNVDAELDALVACTGHPNIVELREVIKDDAFIYIVTEFLSGKELLTYAQEQQLDECQVRKIFKEIVHGITYLHSQHIAHRDLKLENIIFSTENPAQSCLKILDFGFAHKTNDKNNKMEGPCYTLDYAAPEVLTNKNYAESCDLWSLGKFKKKKFTPWRFLYNSIKLSMGPTSQNNLYQNLKKFTMPSATV